MATTFAWGKSALGILARTTKPELLGIGGGMYLR